tara:strand:- start:19848 stop:22466 length:2619 start_codon:yes stop_codon:yes gene_type:complete
MNTLGPHVIFSDSHPTSWCYFKLDLGNAEKPISFYTAPYTTSGGDVTWTESPLKDKSPIYLYDTQEQKPSCYVIDANVLYDVPLQKLARQPHVNAMRKITLESHEITRRLANGKKARDYAVRVEHYPEPDNLTELLNHLPELPITEPVATTPAPSTPFVSSDDAKAMLEVTQCIQVASQADCPTEINKGCMYVWKTGETWAFNVNFLGDLKTGAFDKTLDRDVIKKLNTQPLGNITPEIDSIQHHLNRPYLNLTPHQQAILVATMTPDWPLTAEISPDQQIQVCRAIVGGSALAEDTPQSTEINSNINAFRPYLFPSTINRLYGHNALFTSAPAPKIADIILYTDYLLMGAAQALGDKAAFTIHSPPKSSDVICGQLAGADNQSRLIYQGLSEGRSELFQFIMRAEMQGMEAMPIGDLIQMEPLLRAVMEPSEQGHAFMDLSNDLIASIAAQQNITQNAAKYRLKDTCERMIIQARKTALIRLLSMPQEAAIRALQASTNEDLNSLIQCFFNPDDAAQAKFNSMIQHQYPDAADALTTLHEANLLTGESAQANFNAVVQHQSPRALADTLTALHRAGLLTGESAQANFAAVVQHQNPRFVADALTILHEKDLLTGDSAQANRDAVVRHQNPSGAAEALIQLHCADLLSGAQGQANREAALKHEDPNGAAEALIQLHRADLLSDAQGQANREAALKHYSPDAIASVLCTLNQAGLLIGEQGQANRDALAQHPDPHYVAKALTQLLQTDLLTNESAQANFDAVAQHQEEEDVANALIQLYKAGLLTGDSAQANFNAVIQHEYPDAVANALIQLHEAGLLTGDVAQANRDAVAQSQNPLTKTKTLIKNNLTQNKIKENLGNLKPSSDDSDPGPRP